MISKNVYKFCKDDISLIENYEKAFNDNINVWDCHHRLETDLNVTQQYLIENNLYWKRPASELIFLTRTEHNKLHKKDKPRSEETKRKISNNNAKYWLGKTRSEETRKKQSELMKNKRQSEETRKKKSELMKGKNKGKHRVYRDDGSYYMSY